jgi:hypothetical protein
MHVKFSAEKSEMLIMLQRRVCASVTCSVCVRIHICIDARNISAKKNQQQRLVRMRKAKCVYERFNAFPFNEMQNEKMLICTLTHNFLSLSRLLVECEKESCFQH